MSVPTRPPAPLVAFRADSSVGLGAGHAMRCLTLAEALRALGYEAHLVCRELPGHFAALFGRHGFPVHFLSPDRVEPNPPWKVSDEIADADATLSTLDGRPTWLVVDHYGLSDLWERHVRDRCEHLMVFDDLARCHSHACDLILDQTPGHGPADYPAHTGSLLVGPRHALLRGQFLLNRAGALGRHLNVSGAVFRRGIGDADGITISNATEVRPERPVRTGSYRVLVNMGGTDSANLTVIVLDALARLPLALEADIVISHAFAHRPDLETRLSRLSYPARLHVDVSDMATLMTQAHLCVGAAGTSTWERACLGLPTLALVTADNQLRGATWMAQHDAAPMLDARRGLSAESVATALAPLFEPQRLVDLARNSACVCDGYGVGRVVAAMLNWRARDGKEVNLRPATLGDGEILFAWQCHPDTRRYARNPESPTRPSHFAWLETRLADPGCVFSVIEHGGEPAGTLRLDRTESGAYEISILIDPARQRLNLAAAALRFIRAVLPDIVLWAQVLPDNEASHRLFRGLGYDWNGKAYIHSGIERPHQGAVA